MRYRILGRARRKRVREIARDCFLIAGTPTAAKEKAEAKIRKEFDSIIASILIGLAIRLAIELITYWVKEKFFRPSAEYTQGEPGYTP